MLCKIAKVSRSVYYKWINSNISNDKDLDLKYKILDIINQRKFMVIEESRLDYLEPTA